MTHTEPSSQLEWLLAPFSPSCFWSSYWERCHRLIERNDASYYGELLRISDVDALLPLMGSTPQNNRLRLIKAADGERRQASVPYTERQELDLFRLYESYCQGFTLVLNGVDSRWPAVADLCRCLERNLQAKVVANAYFTPAAAQGFAAHFDTHDVFILQLDGEKRWQIYDGGPELPLKDAASPFVEGELGSPVDDFMLRLGDALYIPRGCIHQAVTTEAPSLHLTVGVHGLRWVDLVGEVVRSAADDDVRLRRTVAVQGPDRQTELDGIRSELVTLLGELARSTPASGGMERALLRSITVPRPVADGHFESLNRLGQIELGSRVRRRSGVECSVLSRDEHSEIHFASSGVAGPASIEPALEYIARSHDFAVDEIPDCLSPSGKLVLARRLVREGLLQVTSPDQGRKSEAAGGP